jgi:hypothetical protein
MPYAESLHVDEPQHEQAPPRDDNLQIEGELPQEVAEEPPDKAPQHDTAPLDAYEPQHVEVMQYTESLHVDEPQHEQAPPRDEEPSPIEEQGSSDARESYEQDVSEQPEHWEAVFWEQTVYPGQQNYPQPAPYREQYEQVPDDGTDAPSVPEAPPYHRDN